MRSMQELILALPKAELHLHIEGTLEPQMVFDLARKHGLCGSSEAERIRVDVVEETFVDLQNDLGGFYWSSRFHDERDEYEPADDTQSGLPRGHASAASTLRAAPASGPGKPR